MKIAISSFRNLLILSLLLFSVEDFSQGITLNTTSTPSICYNDGSIAVKASGGILPYSYSIIAGPVHPNLTYPIIIPAGSDTFIDLPHGTFSIKVTDAAGATDTFAASVGGNYQFPSLTFNTSSIIGIICIDSGGRAPFQYAISRMGSNIGFGAYQSSDTFPNLCSGTYWIRVMDSCGNIFTNVINYSYWLHNEINCYNASKGILDVTALGGFPPYNYHLGSFTNTTGNFSGLPSYYQTVLTITDFCGVTFTQDIIPPSLTLTQPCSYDSNINCMIPSVAIPDTLTFICTNCNPIQITTIIDTAQYGYGSALIFQHLAPNPNYNIIVLGSACGIDTIKSQLLVPTYILSLLSQTCNTVSAIASDESGQYVPIDSFVLSYTLNGPSIQASTNTFPIFRNLPDSTYVITAYIHGGCASNPSASFQIPTFNITDFWLEKDSMCQTRWQLNTTPHDWESFSIISSTNDTLLPDPGSNFPYENFSFLLPNQLYTLSSNSGCSLAIYTPPLPTPISSISTYLPCVGTPLIDYNWNPSTFYSDYVNLTINGSAVTNSTGANTPIIAPTNDTGWCNYAAYLVPAYTNGSLLTRFDATCPIDSGHIYISNNHIPFPYPSSAYVCNLNSNNDSVPYYIYGGTIPYTIEILGYNAYTISVNAGIFQVPHQGNYTMLVYDNCGISRSYTFSVIDSCSGCPIADVSTPNTYRCSGDTVHLINSSIGASTYQWFRNGHLYSTSTNISLVIDSGGDLIQLYAYSSTGCVDSTSLILTDTCHPCTGYSYNHFIITATICFGNSYQLGNNVYTAPGIYIDTIPTLSGCDSIITLNLTVIPAITASNSGPQIVGDNCGAPSFDPLSLGVSGGAGSYNYTVNPGTAFCSAIGYDQPYNTVVTDSLGCQAQFNTDFILQDDSFVVTSLIVTNAICQDSGSCFFTLSGSGLECNPTWNLSIAGTNTGYYNSFSGSRLIDTINVTGLPTDSFSYYLSGSNVCSPYIFGSFAISQLQYFSTTQYDTLCEGSPYVFGNQTYDTSGIYIDTIHSALGCDTLNTLFLTILTNDTPSVIISLSHGPLLAGIQTDTFTATYSQCNNPTYSWYKDTTPLGIHSPIAIISYQAGTHDSILCRVDCSNRCTSIGYTFSNSIFTAVDQISFIQAVAIYPNPTNGSFTMDISAPNISDKEAQISVTDLLGQFILTEPMTLHSGNNKKVVSMAEGSTSGVYVVQLRVEGQSLYYRIVLNR